VRVMGRQPVQDASQHRIRFHQRFAIVESQNRIAQLNQLRRPARVVPHRRFVQVLSAIELDNKPRLDAGEVREVAADGMLAAEFAAIDLTRTKAMPHDTFSIG